MRPLRWKWLKWATAPTTPRASKLRVAVLGDRRPPPAPPSPVVRCRRRGSRCPRAARRRGCRSLLHLEKGEVGAVLSHEPHRRLGAPADAHQGGRIGVHGLALCRAQSQSHRARPARRRALPCSRSTSRRGPWPRPRRRRCRRPGCRRSPARRRGPPPVEQLLLALPALIGEPPSRCVVCHRRAVHQPLTRGSIHGDAADGLPPRQRHPARAGRAAPAQPEVEERSATDRDVGVHQLRRVPPPLPAAVRGHLQPRHRRRDHPGAVLGVRQVPAGVPGRTASTRSRSGRRPATPKSGGPNHSPTTIPTIELTMSAHASRPPTSRFAPSLARCRVGAHLRAQAGRGKDDDHGDDGQDGADAGGRALDGRRPGRRAVPPRVHRQPDVDAAGGRGLRRRRLRRRAAPPARPRHDRRGHDDHRLGRLDGRGRGRLPAARHALRPGRRGRPVDGRLPDDLVGRPAP